MENHVLRYTKASKSTQNTSQNHWKIDALLHDVSEIDCTQQATTGRCSSVAKPSSTFGFLLFRISIFMRRMSFGSRVVRFNGGRRHVRIERRGSSSNLLRIHVFIDKMATMAKHSFMEQSILDHGNSFFFTGGRIREEHVQGQSSSSAPWREGTY